MKAISLDSWAADGKRYFFNQEYEITPELAERFPHKWKITSELKTEIVSSMTTPEVVQIPKAKKKTKK